MLFNKLFLFLLLLVLLKCSPENPVKDLENVTVYSSNIQPVYSISLDSTATFGDSEGVPWGPVVRTIGVDKQDRVFVADLLGNKVHVYDSDGTYIQSVGNAGEGPGEFSFMWQLRINDEDLHILDLMQSKISVYDLNSFTHQNDFNVSIDQENQSDPDWVDRVSELGFVYQASDFEVLSNNNYLISFSLQSFGGQSNEGQTIETSIYDPSKRTYVQHDVHSFRADGTALFGEDQQAISDVIYKPRAQVDHTNDQVVYSWTEDLLFQIYNSMGAYQWSFYYPRESAVLDLNDVFTYYENRNNNEWMESAIRSNAPDHWPAFNSLIIDDENRLWVSSIVENQDTYEWWVLDLNDKGRLLATFPWPRNHDLLQVENGFAYFLASDSDFQKIIKYTIDLDGSI
ncbi:MAG: 6-bladed beta-propeller [Balneolaceae bacterium]